MLWFLEFEAVFGHHFTWKFFEVLWVEVPKKPKTSPSQIWELENVWIFDQILWPNIYLKINFKNYSQIYGQMLAEKWWGRKGEGSESTSKILGDTSITLYTFSSLSHSFYLLAPQSMAVVTIVTLLIFSPCLTSLSIAATETWSH